MRCLVSGWFSFEQMGASAGDLMARDLACQWLEQAGCPYDVAHAPPFSGGVDWRTADPATYSHILFVCGPFGNGPPLVEFLDRFAGRPLIGLDLTMLQSLEEWNPFELLLERDSSRICRPDVVFLSKQPLVPVVGVVLIDTQPEYDADDKKQLANEAIRRLLASREVTAIQIDTRLDENRVGLRTAAEVESLIARTDLVLTTRLHGLVLAIKNGVPALAIDSVAGGAKLSRQARAIDWPAIFTVDHLDDAAVARAFDYCLSPEARARARACRDRAAQAVEQVRQRFIAHMAPRGRKE